MASISNIQFTTSQTSSFGNSLSTLTSSLGSLHSARGSGNVDGAGDDGDAGGHDDVGRMAMAGLLESVRNSYEESSDVLSAIEVGVTNVPDVVLISVALALVSHIRPQAEAGAAHSLRISKRCQAFAKPLRTLSTLGAGPVSPATGVAEAVPLDLTSWPDLADSLRSLVVSLTRAVVLFNFLNSENGFNPWWSTEVRES
jgi:hypothetical protein